jgi:hypothetical protein
MEKGLLKWIEFRKKQLEIIKEGYLAQMKPMSEEIEKIDYEIFLLNDAINEGAFTPEYS